MSFFTDLFKRPRFQPALKQIGDVTRVGLSGRPQAPEKDLPLLFKASSSNEVVYACLQVMAQAAVDPRLYVESRSTGSEWAEVEMHPAQMLMRKPHPMYTDTAFIRAVIVSMHVAGVFYAEKLRATKNGPPVALWPVDPTRLTPVPDGAGGISHYEWKDGGAAVRIEAENIIAWRSPDLTNRYQNISPLGVAMGSIAGDTQQTNYINAFFEGGGVPAGILTVKDRSIDENEADSIRERWRSIFDPKRGGDRKDIAVLDQNAQYQKMGAGMDELESEELRSVAESRICMVFGVPPIIIYSYFGLQRATYSNMEEAWSQFWKSKLTPWFKEYRTFLTNTLLREFEDDTLIDGERVRFQWDMSQVAALADDVDAIATRATLLWEKGVIKRNEARELLGYDADPDGDVYFADAQPQPEPAQIVAPVQQDQPSPDDAQPDPQKALPAPQKKSLTFTPEQIKAIDDGKETIVAKASVEVEQYLFTEYNAAADRGNADGGDDGAKIAAVMTPHYRAAVKLAYDDATEQLAEFDATIDFSLSNPLVRETISGLLERVKSITGTTKEDVRAIIADGLERGQSIDQIAAKIRERAPDLSRSRAEMIARTETADAYTRGSILAYEESSVVTGLEWNATLDNRTSQICTGLHGQKIGLKEKFSNGTQGPPAHPNCRSVVLPIVD